MMARTGKMSMPWAKDMICRLTGLDAIDAVLNAAETNYFYFCANEETGEVFYAETQEQHEENLVLAGLTEE